MVFGLLDAKPKAGPVAPPKAAAPAPWPWASITEVTIRATMQARIRYLTNQKYPVLGETPDFSQSLVELGTTFNQRQKLRELWREEVATFAEKNK